MSQGDWQKLSVKQQLDVQALRDRMNQHLIAETEAFYKEHPELQLTWNFTCDAIIRATPKYNIGNRVNCCVEGVPFSGVVEQYHTDLGTVIYHVDALMPGLGILPLFVQENEIIGIGDMTQQ